MQESTETSQIAVPRPTTNHEGLQAAFTQYSNYLDALAKHFSYEEIFSRIGGGAGIRTKSDASGVTIDHVIEDSDIPDLWQVWVYNDRLYIRPAYAHFKPDDDTVLYTSYMPVIHNDSILDDKKPYWGLPLEEDTEFVVYLIIFPCNDSGSDGSDEGEDEDATEDDEATDNEDTDDEAPVDTDGTAYPPTDDDITSEAGAWLELIEADKDIEDFAPKGSHVFAVHRFTTDEEGLPILTEGTQLLHSEPTICADSICSSSSSNSSSSNSSSGSSSDDDDSGDSSGSGESKDSAIVPASFHKEGYAAWFITEAPDVRFVDFVSIGLRGRVTFVKLDYKAIEGMELSTLSVCGYTVDKPCPVGCHIVVRGSKAVFVVVTQPWWWVGKATKISFQITAVRKGFLGLRLPERTIEQQVANDETLNSAYPSKQEVLASRATGGTGRVV